MPASVHVLPAPWNKDYIFEEQFHRATKKNSPLHEWTRSGWRVKGYEDGGNKKSDREYRYITDAVSGRKYKVPEGDYQDFLKFTRTPEPKADSKIGQYVQEAFETATQEVAGKGHILNMIYNSRRQVLFVDFESDNATVAYFRVPVSLFAELRNYAISDSGRVEMLKNGKRIFRHILGIEFWNLIRIRGTRTGGRYKYEYVTDIVGAAQPETEPVDVSGDISSEDFDRLANTFLDGTQKAAYSQMKGITAKEKFLKRHGIL